MEKIIFWDIGNVILKPIHGQILNDIYNNKENEINRDNFNKKTSEILNDSFIGKISLDQTWNELFKVGNIYDEKVKQKIKKINVIRNEKLIDYIKNSSENNIKNGIISDLSQIGYWIVQEYFKDFLSICNKENIYISVETKKTKRKNQYEYFNDIKEKNNNKELFFIDDEEKNIISAQKANYNTFLFKSECGWDYANEKLIREISKIK